MSASRNKSASTRLSDAQFELCLAAARSQLQSNSKIRNQELRRIAQISYDQAISFFNRAIGEKHLIREGTASGTRYVLPPRSKRS